MSNKTWSIIGVPIDGLGVPGGTELSPAALRTAGLVQALAAQDLGDLPVRIVDPQRDPASGMIGFAGVYQTTLTIRQYLADVLRRGERPVVVGGCCTLLLGVMAAARDVFGQVGLVYADGHMDLYDGQTSPGGEAADMPLGLLLGYGPAALQPALGPDIPVVTPGDVALVGYRDLAEAASYGSRLPADLGPHFTHIDADSIRRLTPAYVGQQVVKHLEAGTSRFWLHLDFDILDQAIFPDDDYYLLPNGLTRDELVHLLRPIATSPGLIGVDIACYNPEKDKQGLFAQQIIQHLTKILNG
jgi:arginase